MINNTWHENSKKMTVQKITALSFLSAILIIVKFIFGFVPGIEFVTSLLIIYGILLPYKNSLLLVCVFNLLVLIIYGFGPWWIVYWPIFLTDVTIGRVLKKWFKNKFVLAFFSFLLGFSVLPWYFLSNMLWFGWGYAYASLFSALPINLIEGLSNFVFCIIVAPALVKILNKFLPNIWGQTFDFEFKTIKRKKLNFFGSISMIFMSISAIGLFFGFNTTFLNASQRASTQVSQGNYTKLILGSNYPQKMDLNNLILVPNNSLSKCYLLSNSSLDYLYHLMIDSQSAIVVILNNKTYVRINDGSFNHIVQEYIMGKKNQWYLSGVNYPLLGLYINTFTDGLYTYNAKYPLYFAIYVNKFQEVNGSLEHLRLYSNVGVSTLKINTPREIVTITLTNE